MSDLRVTIRPPRRQSSGRDPVALLVHGTMDRATSFTRLAQQLPEWTVVTYDRRGYAHSAGRAASREFSDQVDDLVEVAQQALPVADPARVVAFGHSLGGDVVLGAACSQPDLFGGAVVYEPPCPWKEWWTGHGGGSWRGRDPGDMAESFMRQVLGASLWERLPAATRAQRRREGTTMLAELDAVAAAAPYVAGKITIPVVVARGSAAAARHVRATDELAGALPDVELAVVEGADHGAHLSHAKQLAELLRRALARAGTPRGSRR